MGKTIQGSERNIILKVYKFFEKEKDRGSLIIPINQVTKRISAATGVSKEAIIEKTIQGGVINVLSKVIQYFEKEKDHGSPIIPIDRAIKRVCAATGVSIPTIMRIKNEEKQQILSHTFSSSLDISSFLIKLETPGKKRKPSTKRIELKYCDINALNDIIKSLIAENDNPTLDKIFAKAKNQLNFTGQRTTLRRLLKEKFGFPFNKNNYVQHVCVQKPETKHENCCPTVIEFVECSCTKVERVA